MAKAGVSGATDNGRERRTNERRQVDVAVRIVLGESSTLLPGRLRDLSETGAYLVTDMALRPGEEVAFGLAFASGSIGVASGHVVRVDGGGVGVRLRGMNTPLRELISG